MFGSAGRQPANETGSYVALFGLSEEKHDRESQLRAVWVGQLLKRQADAERGYSRQHPLEAALAQKFFGSY